MGFGGHRRLGGGPGFLSWDGQRRASAAFERHEVDIARILIDVRTRIERPSLVDPGYESERSHTAAPLTTEGGGVALGDHPWQVKRK